MTPCNETNPGLFVTLLCCAHTKLSWCSHKTFLMIWCFDDCSVIWWLLHSLKLTSLKLWWPMTNDQTDNPKVFLLSSIMCSILTPHTKFCSYTYYSTYWNISKFSKSFVQIAGPKNIQHNVFLYMNTSYTYILDKRTSRKNKTMSVYITQKINQATSQMEHRTTRS